ncbi:hypothetical protein [Pseudomonas sp. 22 E 5]|nr:hypothetical protein [Pseudomonas sp. 22 E 5]
MHHKHQAQCQVRDHHKAAELDDVLQVGAGDHFGHQCQHTVRRQLHDQAHQTHYPGLQSVDGVEHFLALFHVILEQLQRGNPQECGENHHADDRRRLGAGKICKRVGRHERQQQLRDIQVGHLAGVIALDHLQACHFLGAGHQAFGGEAEQVGQADTDQRRNRGGEQQRADGQEADLAQGRGVMQARHGTEDRGEHQRDHDHLQQLHVAIADQIKPADRGLEHRVAVAIKGVQHRTEHHAQDEGKQHLLGEAPVGATGLCQAQQQGHEHQ